MNIYIKNVVTVFSLCFLISCTDNLNFDEINLNVDPIITAPLIYFELDQDDFFNTRKSPFIDTCDKEKLRFKKG